MANNFPFDLNSSIQFPTLAGIVVRAFNSMPTEFDYHDFTLPKSLAKNDFKTIAQKVKKYIPQFIQTMRLHFADIINERDCVLATNIPGKDQRDFNIEAYNKMVVKKIEHIIKLMYFSIEFSCELNEEQKRELNIKQYFNEWYKEFPIKEEPGANEPIPSNTTPNNKLKWTGTPSQFGFVIDLLITGGYLKKPSTSFVKDAKYYSTIFDIDTTPGTLAKEVSENTNSLNTENRKKFKIPAKDDLLS